ncbi:GNAT family N-acetyltransferase [Flavobacterium crassostreae]|uniref:GNAT family acetyltransferase n=1 Tax=Flavobacterium crassostreae TaxID=1763534 RepID=A0A1B9E0I5_9FLAO|nr:GNAT family N-acetyltransferase [Flavobacterium crassostreae]OCB75439.1 GNAT family acetyltransferase [Flavobacterium crassostreae]
MALQWQTKPFEALTVNELYDLLQLRSQVFVVEQNCVYLDIDSKDKLALHLFATYKGAIVAHARLLEAGISYPNASIGRVVVASNFRDRKWGQELMRHAIAGIATHFKTTKITIGAQQYLQKFYESHGFVPTSAMYLEDGIPHLQMTKD